MNEPARAFSWAVFSRVSFAIFFFSLSPIFLFFLLGEKSGALLQDLLGVYLIADALNSHDGSKTSWDYVMIREHMNGMQVKITGNILGANQPLNAIIQISNLGHVMLTKGHKGIE